MVPGRQGRRGGHAPLSPLGFAPVPAALVAGAAAGASAAAAVPLLLKLARRRGWVAEPTGDRWHEAPRALVGGVAIFTGASLGWLLLVPGGPPWHLWIAAAAVFTTGLVDDFRGVSPAAKVVVPVGAAGLLIRGGWELAPGWPLWLSAGATFVWVVLITNAFNLIDNMDGLSAGVAAIAGLALAALGLLGGDVSGAGRALVLAAAAGGFLLHNFPPARSFMGDSGSLFLGFSVAALAMAVPGRGVSGALASVLVPVAVAAVPILDTALVALDRARRGRSPAVGGRDHSSHRLVLFGLSERRAVILLYGLSAAFALLALFLQYANVYLSLAVMLFATVALVALGLFLGQLGTDEETDGGDRPVARAAGGTAVARLSRLLLAGGDLLLVVAAFVAAHFLAAPGGFDAGRVTRLLPWLAVLKVGTFWAFGLYRGLLRYTGARELIRAGQASTAASVLAAGAAVLILGAAAPGWPVLVVDWLVVTVSVVGLRAGYRALRGWLAGQREAGRRVLLYGAGDAGVLALQELRQNRDLGLVPVGFVDDDPAKQGREVRGLPVLGGGEEVAELCRGHDADGVVVTVGPEDRPRLLRRCQAAGVPCGELRVDLTPPGDA